MTDDRFMAELLGETPRTPDPAFRVEVFARVAERAQRRAAFERGSMQLAACTALGLVVPVAQAAGLSAEELTPLLLTIGALATAGLFAFTVIVGPKAALARTKGALGLAR